MSVDNPQNNDLILSQWCSRAQDFCGVLAFIISVIQSLTLFMSAKIFIVLTGFILVVEYGCSYFKCSFFNKGHRLREIGLIDNSFNEKRIPNYDGNQYYNNSTISKEEIKLLANMHENALFTFRIAEKMSIPYYVIFVVSFCFFIVMIFMRGMDDYSSLLLSFIVSSSFFDRVIKLNSLKAPSEDVYEKANEICSSYEKTPTKTNLIVPKILELLLLYENAVFESKIILCERIFKKLNPSLSREWQSIRDAYLIYKAKE